MIGTIDIEIQAKNPNMALWPLRAYVNSPSSLRLRNVPKKIGQWEITAVQVNVNYPDKTQKTTQCVLVGGVWVGTVEGSSATGSYTNGYTVLANGTDENGNPVSGYVLGRGDVEILKEDGTPIADDPTHFVTDDELEAAISSKAEISDVDDVANDLADLSNSLSDYYTKSETSSAVELDAKFETKADLSALNEVADSLSDYYTKTETSSATEIQTALNGKQPTGDYALTSQIPTKTSDLSNDNDYITSAQVEPDSRFIGFSKSSNAALHLYNITNGTVYDNLNSLWLDNGQPFVEGMEYYPWQLTKWFNDTFATPLQLEFKYIENIQVPLVPGTTISTNKSIKQYGWIGSSGQLTHYIIKAEHTNPNKPNDFEPTAMGKFDAPSSNFMPITISNNLKSVETVNGQSGVVSCTRTDTYKTTRKTLVFEDELSVKADVSALNAVENSLSDYALTSQIPLSVSQLENDAGYLTEHQSLSDYYTKSETSSAVEIDAQFETKADLSALETKQDQLDVLQLEVINEGVDEKKTIVKFYNGSIVKYDVVGEVTQAMVQEWQTQADSSVKEVKFGNTVTSIGSAAFSQKNLLTTVEFSDSIQTLGSNAFSYCRNLTTLKFGKGLLSMGSAFVGCNGLTTIVLPESLLSLEYTFNSCVNLTTVVLPDSLTSLGRQTFDNCTSLSRVVFGKNLDSIGQFCFRGCTSLAYVDLPENLATINSGVFDGCTALTHLTIGKNVENLVLAPFGQIPTLTELTFKDRTISQVQAMTDYPWGITDTSIIKTWNVASQEWVLEQLAAL